VTQGLCRRYPGQSRGVSGRTGTHRCASGVTPGMYHRKPYHNWDRPWSLFAPNRVRSVALPGMYERNRVPSRFVPVRPGPPAAYCRGAPGRTPGQSERGLSLCGWRSGVFTFASVLSWKHAWRHAWVFVTGLKRQTRIRTSWNVPSFIGRTRTCSQLRSERTDDGMRTHCGRVERSVNEVVELWTGVDEIELVTKRNWIVESITVCELVAIVF